MDIQTDTARENVFRRANGAWPSWVRAGEAGVVIVQTPRHQREAGAP